MAIHPQNPFPPQPDHEHEWEALVGVLASAVGGREADYVSTPITTGQRFLAWYHAEGHALERGSDAYKRAHEAQVIRPNGLDAQEFVARLRRERRLVIEPTSLCLPHWTQNDYRHLWGKVIERYARRVVLLDGWQFSSGCSFEFYVAARSGIDASSQDGQFISREQGCSLIAAAIVEMEAIQFDTAFLKQVFQALQALDYQGDILEFKDDGLNLLARSGNVAQFVSFAPGTDPEQRYCHISGVPTNHRFDSIEVVVATLLEASPERRINIRSFKPDQYKNQPFVMGIESTEKAIDTLRTLAEEGYFTIANEAIDIHDGGISGVLAGGTIEFAPDDTPRCVEMPNIARLPTTIALEILETVYGFTPALHFEPSRRVEFSIHPQRRGVRREHTIIWEIGTLDEAWRAQVGSESLVIGLWPNRFSAFLGDKVYGLLIAQAVGAKVPRAQVIHRRIAPFAFGTSTCTGESWIRTAPGQREAGRYPTHRGWHDPFELMKELPSTIPSVFAQESVASVWSGSLITEYSGPRIEGVRGFGNEFMLGNQPPEDLPATVFRAVRESYDRLSVLLGPVSIEWAFDGENVWVLQLHQERSVSSGATIVPGKPSGWEEVNTPVDLERLRQLVEKSIKEDKGIRLRGIVGITSHVAEILRRAGVPSEMVLR